MDDQLKKLRNSMNKTVLRDITLSEQQKAYYKHTTLNHSTDTNNNKRQRFFQNRLNWVLSFSVCLVLLGGTVYYAANNMGLFTNQASEGPSSPEQNTALVLGDDKEKETTEDDPEIKKPEYVDETLTKNDVHYRLLNSIDYFEAAKGTFEVTSQSASYEYNVEYKIQLGDELASYSKTIDEKGNVSKIEIYNSNKEKILRIDPNTKTYTFMNYAGFHDGGPLAVESHYSVGEDGVPVTMNRGRPPSGGAHSSLFAQEITTNYLRDERNWEIIKQTERYLDEPVITIGGKLNDYASKKHQSKTFKFWVHKPTGFLLKYETYNKQGDVINSLVTTSFEWNEKLDPTVFELEPPEDYTDKTKERVAVKETDSDPREKEIEHISGAKYDQDEVSEVINEIKEKAPFYYEFHQPDLEIYSASLEKYHEHYNVMTYIVPKAWNEEGYKDFSIYVRQYNENSFVKEVSEFSGKDGGRQFDEFNANGIEWEGVYQQKSKDDFRTFAIGEKDGIMYEIVGQNLKPEQLKQYLQSFQPSK
jgi:outer membrane lipoprotein-sorting protein